MAIVACSLQAKNTNFIVMERIQQFWQSLLSGLRSIWEFVNIPLLKESEITMGTILYIAFGFILLSYLSKKVRRILVHGLLERANVEASSRASIGAITRYVILLIGSIFIIQSAGIDLSALSLLAGALGVGIGFGLQNITDNFISGLIILFEKPIKVGDRIEVGDVDGDVINISVRATTIQTNDNISMIIPNSEFISQKVINWSHNDRNIRYRIPIGVSYNEDPEQVKSLLLDVAARNENVLEKPEPRVFFDEFADSSINFTLAIWTSTFTDRPRLLKSEILFEVFKVFREKEIEIPFPQQDIHIKKEKGATAIKN